MAGTEHQSVHIIHIEGKIFRNDKKQHPDITVAKITTAGVIIAAIIGLVGILLTNRPTNDNDVSLTPVTQNPRILEFEVESTKSWQIVDQVEEGDMVTVTYKFGEWTNNKNNIDSRSPYVSADGYLTSTRSPFEDFVAGSNLAALMGRVGEENIWKSENKKHSKLLFLEILSYR